MNFALVAVLVLLALLEGTHAAALHYMRDAKPRFLKELGRAGPGYYFLGLAWFSPDYRRQLFSGRLAVEFAPFPLVVRLLEIEKLLWFTMWVAIVLLVVL